MSEMFQVQSAGRAYVMINCEYGSEDMVLDILRDMRCIKQIEHTVGIHDIFVEISGETLEDLRNIIEFQIRKIPVVKSTTTLICGKTYEVGAMC